jgi:glycosyltransferase involved in cell wall biosynthesis
VRLRLVGDDAYPALAGGGVEGVGPVDRPTLFSDYYARADAVLVPSRAEGFGFAAVEAMGHGIPVVASRRDALPEIVGDGGWLVDAESVSDLARAMEAAATDPAAARSRGRAARSRFEAVYEVGLARRRLGELYGRLLRRPVRREEG